MTYPKNGCEAPVSAIRINRRAGNPRQGWLTAARQTIPVALGRGGIMANKREGDGGTPRGTFQPRQLWWRADRGPLAAPAVVVGGRPQPAPAPLSAGSRHPPRRRLVRGPAKPPLQPA